MKKNQELRVQLASAKALKESMDRASKPISGQFMAYAEYYGYHDFMFNYSIIYLQVERLTVIPYHIMFHDSQRTPKPDKIAGIGHKRYFDTVYTSLLMLISFLEETVHSRVDELSELSNFFQDRLRRVILQEPEVEKTIQDAVESLLIGRGLNKGNEYDREPRGIKISGREFIPDFAINKLSLSIEVKLSKTKQKRQDIIEEINADIQAYKVKYSNLLFIIYDIGSITDENEFKSGVNSQDGDVKTIIIKH